jgi:hypothetical protein
MSNIINLYDKDNLITKKKIFLKQKENNRRKDRQRSTKEKEWKII